MFEPNYRFTKYRGGLELLSESSGDALLYKVRLPCPLNPFLYIIFRDSELSAVDMLGNAETDTRVVIHRQCHVVHVEDNVEDNFDPRESSKCGRRRSTIYPTAASCYSILLTEEVVLPTQISRVGRKRKRSFVLLPRPTMTRIVFRNEQTDWTFVATSVEQSSSIRYTIFKHL